MPSIIGWIKNGRKGKNLAYMPASYPSSRITHESVSVTADGVKTEAEILNSLYTLVDFSKVRSNTILEIEASGKFYVFNVIERTSNSIRTMYTTINTNVEIFLSASSSRRSCRFDTITPTDQSTMIELSGVIFRVVY